MVTSPAVVSTLKAAQQLTRRGSPLGGVFLGEWPEMVAARQRDVDGWPAQQAAAVASARVEHRPSYVVA